MVKLDISKKREIKKMSRKRRNFNAEFKTKVVLELLEGDKTISEIASKYDLLPKSLQQWKKQFLENASLAFVLVPAGLSSLSFLG